MKFGFVRKSVSFSGWRILAATVAFLSVADRARALPIATFNTSLGSFEVELRSDVAPLTVQNFINYVDSGAYNNTIIHRSVSDFIIQGGGYSAAGAPFTATNSPPPIATNAPVQNEYDLPNTAGTLAMALLANEPNSATSQWFFNLADNSSNLDSQSFTVFGDVLGNGMNVIDAIAAVPVFDGSGVWGSAFSDLPLQNFDNTTATQITTDNLVMINSVTISTPEPGTVVLLLSGGALLGMGMRRRRRYQGAKSISCRHAGVAPDCATGTHS